MILHYLIIKFIKGKKHFHLHFFFSFSFCAAALKKLFTDLLYHVEVEVVLKFHKKKKNIERNFMMLILFDFILYKIGIENA